MDNQTLKEDLKNIEEAYTMVVTKKEDLVTNVFPLEKKTIIVPEISSVGHDMQVKMDIVHDIPKAIVEDITFVDFVLVEENSRIESETIDYVCNMLEGGSIAKKMKELEI
ncbi:HD domain-containing protein YBR242W-like [Asparagus officinalis]|uniref:HD domain-containing protein YBR242W-like n=1 Tax=Asparagus officinalis TaxID=4686 RepID=UPI00098E7BD7|nr:HD domain-containing protein YBR242W-like [Asparagus officinalis]